jgi:hypothetical protein
MLRLVQIEKCDNLKCVIVIEDLKVETFSHFLFKKLKVDVNEFLKAIGTEKDQAFLLHKIEISISNIIASLCIDNNLLPVELKLSFDLDNLDGVSALLDSKLFDVSSSKVLNSIMTDELKGISFLFVEIIFYCLEYSIEIENDEVVRDKLRSQVEKLLGDGNEYKRI